MPSFSGLLIVVALFLAGLEIDFAGLRGPVPRRTGAGYAISFTLAVLVSLVPSGAGLVDTPLLVAIALASTSLGVLGSRDVLAARLTPAPARSRVPDDTPLVVM
jgi:hypothetical protein